MMEWSFQLFQLSAWWFHLAWANFFNCKNFSRRKEWTEKKFILKAVMKKKKMLGNVEKIGEKRILPEQLHRVLRWNLFSLRVCAFAAGCRCLCTILSLSRSATKNSCFWVVNGNVIIDISFFVFECVCDSSAAAARESLDLNLHHTLHNYKLWPALFCIEQNFYYLNHANVFFLNERFTKVCEGRNERDGGIREGKPCYYNWWSG